MSPVLATSTGTRLIFAPFLLIGVAMLIWNERIARAMIASNRAFANELGITPFRRVNGWFERQHWYIPAIRIYTVLFSLLWLGICVAGLVEG